MSQCLARWIPQNKPGPLWHGCYDESCPCMLLTFLQPDSGQSWGRGPTAAETLVPICMTDSMIEQICEGFMIVELSQMKG